MKLKFSLIALCILFFSGLTACQWSPPIVKKTSPPAPVAFIEETTLATSIPHSELQPCSDDIFNPASEQKTQPAKIAKAEEAQKQPLHETADCSDPNIVNSQ
jgi:hypothetical protein